MAESINAAIIERLEKVVDTLQDNSVKMGNLLAVHNEKLDKQDRIDGVLFEKIESVSKKRWVNKQRVLVFGSRGINAKMRYFIDDLLNEPKNIKKAKPIINLLQNFYNKLFNKY